MTALFCNLFARAIFMTVSVPYNWLKQVPPALLQKEGVPPFGYPPPFPWDEYATALGQALQEQNTALIPGAWQKLAKDEHLKGFGSDPLLFTIDLAPLPGLAWLVVAKTELDRFISWILTKRENLASLLDPAYRVGFCQFIALEFFNVFRKSTYGKELTPHLASTTPVAAEDLYSQDFSFALNGVPSFAARMIFSEELRHAWKEKFAERSVDGAISMALAEKLSLTLHLEAGHTVLSAAEWKQIHPGDFLLISHCSIDPTKDKGRVMLTLDRRPLYRARIKEGKLKILEFPLYHEVESTMATTHDADEEEYEGFEAEETQEEEHEDHAAVDTEELSEATETSEAPAAPAEKAPKASEAAALEAAVPEEAAEKVNVGNLPLTIVVEIGRLQISIRKLLEMQPGDTLDLDVDPDSSVDLVVNGVVVAKGELLKIGEMLGVRILDKV